MNSHNELVSQESQKSNLWYYLNIKNVEALELNGFVDLSWMAEFFFDIVTCDAE